jgi:hypothetical protein
VENQTPPPEEERKSIFFSGKLDRWASQGKEKRW